jgi:hypothetical protein
MDLFILEIKEYSFKSFSLCFDQYDTQSEKIKINKRRKEHNQIFVEKNKKNHIDYLIKFDNIEFYSNRFQKIFNYQKLIVLGEIDKIIFRF